LRLIFASSDLTSRAKSAPIYPKDDPRSKILAYVQWFSKPSRQPHAATQLYAVQRSYDKSGQPVSSVIELENIVQPCYLLPRFAKQARELGQNINGDNVLDIVDNWWINSFHDQATYQTIF
jgi:hypothetical protein